MKIITMLACSLLDITGIIRITDGLLKKMKLLEYAYSLSDATLYKNPDGSWKTLHTRWNMELIYFLYSVSDANLVYERRRHLKKAIQFIFTLEDEKIVTSVIRILYDIAARGKIAIEIVESVVDIPNYLSDSSKCILYVSCMAFANEKLRRYENAVMYCDKTIEINPNYIDAWYNKGINLAKLEKYDNAVQCFDKTIEINQNHAGAWYNKGLALSDLRINFKNSTMKNKEARDCVKRAVQIDRSYAKPWHNKGYRMSSSLPVQIVTDVPTSKGLLDFGKYSILLANIIENSKPRFTVGIFGEWGTGKTTLMEMVRKEIDRNESLLTVWFDAWRYEKEEHIAVIPFLRTIRLTLEEAVKTKDGRWEGVKRGLERTSNAFLKSISLSYGPVSMDLEKLVNSLKSISSVGDNINIIYYHATDYLKTALKNHIDKNPGSRIVIFIDDLDRCTPEKALEILESIKSFFDFDGIVYVIGMNYRSIDALVQKKYGKRYSITGYSYMEKIVQVPFQIPDWLEGDILQYIDSILSKEINNLDFVNELSYTKNRDLLLKAVEWNPREVKRFINNLIFAKAVFDKPIDNLIAFQALKFREEWNKFLNFIMPIKTRIAFLNDYKKLSNNEIDSDTFKNKYDIEQVYPSFFNQNDALRKFLDAGATDKLLNIENMEEYRRAIDIVEVKDESSNLFVAFDNK